MINFLLVLFGFLGFLALCDLVHIMVVEAKEEKELHNATKEQK